MSNYSEAGKGSSTRPLSVPKETFDNNWDMIFKKKDSTDDLLCTDEMKKLNGPCDMCRCPK